jgi:hypothetical protein
MRILEAWYLSSHACACVRCAICMYILVHYILRVRNPRICLRIDAYFFGCMLMLKTWWGHHLFRACWLAALWDKHKTRYILVCFSFVVSWCTIYFVYEICACVFLWMHVDKKRRWNISSFSQKDQNVFECVGWLAALWV